MMGDHITRAAIEASHGPLERLRLWVPGSVVAAFDLDAEEVYDPVYEADFLGTRKHGAGTQWGFHLTVSGAGRLYDDAREVQAGSRDEPGARTLGRRLAHSIRRQAFVQGYRAECCVDAKYGTRTWFLMPRPNISTGSSTIGGDHANEVARDMAEAAEAVDDMVEQLRRSGRCSSL